MVRNIWTLANALGLCRECCKPSTYCLTPLRPSALIPGRERAGPLPSIAVADALLDERRKLTAWISEPGPA
jgi:hypothetical protein